MQVASSQKILVIVPTYNEVENVGPLHAGIELHAANADILFVDDNSTDGTRAVIAQLMAARPGCVHILERERKQGLGRAYVAGFIWGLARAYDAFVEMDADLSHRPEDLARIIQALAEAPAVVGSRYIAGGATENWDARRRLISRMGSFYARLVLALPLRDLTGGFNGWRRETLEAVGPKDVQSEGYAFQVELKFRAYLAGFKIREIPILFVERRAGQSKMSGRIVREAIVRIWLLAFQRGEIKRRIASRRATDLLTGARGTPVSARS